MQPPVFFISICSQYGKIGMLMNKLYIIIYLLDYFYTRADWLKPTNVVSTHRTFASANIFKTSKYHTMFTG